MVIHCPVRAGVLLLLLHFLFRLFLKWWNNIVDEFEMVLNIDGKRYKVSVYPQNLEDTHLFAKYIVEQIFGEIEQSESLVARIESLLNERVDLLKDPRQEKDMKFPSRDDILFSINVSYPTNSKFILKGKLICEWFL